MKSIITEEMRYRKQVINIPLNSEMQQQTSQVQNCV